MIGLLTLDYSNFDPAWIYWLVLIIGLILGWVYNLVSKKPKPPVIARTLGVILGFAIYFGYTHLAGHLVFSSHVPYS